MNHNTDTTEGMEFAIHWVKTVILPMIKEGGLWLVPRSFTVYELHHSQKRLVRKEGPGDQSVEDVFRAMKWNVDTGANNP